ncbi:MAG: hypothetical protein AAB373_05030 [Patescibacteria group bacterium]
MQNRDRYFKGQEDNETLVCFTRQHWIVLLPDLIFFMIFIAFVTVSIVNLPEIKAWVASGIEGKTVFLITFIIATLYFHRFFIKILNYFLCVEIITDKRLIEHHKTVFFKDLMDAIDLSQIQNIEMNMDGFLPNIFKYGKITIFLNSSSAVRTFTYVTNVQFHFRCINRQKTALQSGDIV